MNKNSLLNKGFTLIELLVVIAIIGILAAVVLGSLNDARSGGQDASIKQSIANTRSQAELVYNRTGATQYSYTGVCSDKEVNNLIIAALKVLNSTASPATSTAAATNSATDPSLRKARCQSSDQLYIIEAPLSKGDGFWCVDNTGISQRNTTANDQDDYTCGS